MTRHRLTAAAVLVPLVLVAGCTSSSKHHSKTTSSTTGSSAASQGAQQLATKLHASLATLTSTAIAIDAGGLIANTSGHIKLDNGKATASDITIGSGTDATRVITVGNDVVASLPKGQNTTGKPYIKVSATSSNEFVRGLASTVDILQAAASLGDLADLVGTSSGFSDLGLKTGGTHEYTFNIAGNANGSNLEKQVAELGSNPVGVDLFVNAQNLPVKVSLNIKVGGAALNVAATLSDFNAPVTITAPPANQVAGG